MPQTIRLICFNKDFSGSSPVSVPLLKDIVANDEKLKLEEEENKYTLLNWNEGNKEWWSLLWLYPDGSYAHINANPIFEYGLYYDLVNVAQLLNACILSEDGMLLFIPKYGVLYDPDEREDLQIEIGMLHTELLKTDNLALSIKNIILNQEKIQYQNQAEIIKKQKKREDSYKTVTKIEAMLQAKQYYILAAIFIIMTIILTIKKMNK
jgi:hypothetical protein